MSTPAFPFYVPSDGQVGPYINAGMTLRDYFAGQALIAVVTCDYTVGPDKQAKWAYDIADSMARLITDEEYAALVGEERSEPGTGSPSAKRLTSYDELRAENVRLRAQLAIAEGQQR